MVGALRKPSEIVSTLDDPGRITAIRQDGVAKIQKNRSLKGIAAVRQLKKKKNKKDNRNLTSSMRF
jgi:hypothetical protein